MLLTLQARSEQVSDWIPMEQVEFFWNAPVGGAPTEFVIEQRDQRYNPETGFFNEKHRSLISSGGAHSTSWMKEGPGISNTPEAFFAQLWLDVSPDRESIKLGLSQIAKIKECEWARKMLASLDFIDEVRE